MTDPARIRRHARADSGACRFRVRTQSSIPARVAHHYRSMESLGDSAKPPSSYTVPRRCRGKADTAAPSTSAKGFARSTVARPSCSFTPPSASRSSWTIVRITPRRSTSCSRRHNTPTPGPRRAAGATSPATLSLQGRSRRDDDETTRLNPDLGVVAALRQRSDPVNAASISLLRVLPRREMLQTVDRVFAVRPLARFRRRRLTLTIVWWCYTDASPGAVALGHPIPAMPGRRSRRQFDFTSQRSCPGVSPCVQTQATAHAHGPNLSRGTLAPADVDDTLQ